MTDDAKKGYKKRGRKPKNAKKVDKPPPKKRGRKPKGGKIIKNISDLNTNQIVKIGRFLNGSVGCNIHNGDGGDGETILQEEMLSRVDKI